MQASEQFEGLVSRYVARTNVAQTKPQTSAKENNFVSSNYARFFGNANKPIEVDDYEETPSSNFIAASRLGKVCIKVCFVLKKWRIS